MAAKGLWGIDLGESALRAARAESTGERIVITAFDVVEYKQLLSAPGADREALLRQALSTFLSRNQIGKEKVLVCMPGHTALIRFVNLPPVDRSAIPDVVRYEASVQIPFPLEEVNWDYHPIDRGFVPGEQVEVGLFAMRKGQVAEFLSHLTAIGLEPDGLAVIASALYNYIQFDLPPAATANVIMDMGATNTVLLILSQDTIWTRNLPVGGNDFTHALEQEFNISFGEAEMMKRQIASSAQARQAATALEPVFARLVDELQKSLGYYRSLHADILVENVYALGGGFKLPGLAKYIADNINMPVKAPTRLQNFDIAQAKNPDLYKQHALSFAPTLGLLAQGLQMGRPLDISLLPPGMLTGKIIARKKTYAFAALGIVLALAGISYLKVANVKANLSKGAVYAQKVNTKVTEIKGRQAEFNRLKDASRDKQRLEQLLTAAEDRGHWPEILRRLAAPIKVEPENDSLWLVRIQSEQIDLAWAAEDLVARRMGTLPPALTAAGTGPEDTGLPSLFAIEEAGPRGGRPRRSLYALEEEEEEYGIPAAPERLVLRLEVAGELNLGALPDFTPPPSGIPEGTRYVAKHYAEILDKDPWFTGVRIMNTESQPRYLQEGKQLPPEQALAADRSLLPGVKQVYFTEFAVELYVDPKEELDTRVEELLQTARETGAEY